MRTLREHALDNETVERRIRLRDEFAMAALNATITIWEAARNTPQRMAERSYEIADAMMEARKS